MVAVQNKKQCSSQSKCTVLTLFTEVAWQQFHRPKTNIVKVTYLCLSRCARRAR